MTATALQINQVTVGTVADSNEAIGLVDNALEKLFRQRADLGAYANRLEITAKGLMVAYENMQAAESQIRDVDMAEEMIEFTRNQILETAAMSMLAQSNLKGQNVLRLLNNL
jgi:flagellin